MAEDPAPAPARVISQPLIAGIVASLVGFSTTFALILAGFRSVGATSEQASSGLLVLCLGMAVTSVALGPRTGR